jgi:superfamily I DNA/RNA helicase
LIVSSHGQRRKIKGVAGCGKTLVLAKRAVNAHLRTNKRVLILTYNIALLNYIKDRINDVRENFYWNNFYITNYHQFFKSEASRYNLPCDNLKNWDDIKFFSKTILTISTYDIVLIDEIQDYKQEWIDMIAKYFLSSNAEFIVFGDEKQNIYEREMGANKEPEIRTIPGAWNKSLSTSYRFSSKIGKLALAFQKAHLKNRYSLDELKTLSELDFGNNVIQYHYLEKYDSNYIYDHIFDFAGKNKIHPSDICILSSKIESLRQLDFIIRSKKKEKTTLTFETNEEFNFCNGDKSKLERIRRTRKLHFKMNAGTIKISSVHSFKGWESHTLFFIIDNDDWGDEKNTLELIYTGITRARVNLIIINIGKKQFDPFFIDNVEHVFKPKLTSINLDDLPF